MQFMAYRGKELVSAKEMSEKLGISFEFLSKSLQGLMKGGLIVSVQGIRGGYQLAKSAEEISVVDVLAAMGENKGIVECMTMDEHDSACHREGVCTIRNPLGIIQKRIDDILRATTVAELAAPTQAINFIPNITNINNGVNNG